MNDLRGVNYDQSIFSETVKELVSIWKICKMLYIHNSNSFSGVKVNSLWEKKSNFTSDLKFIDSLFLSLWLFNHRRKD